MFQNPKKFALCFALVLQLQSLAFVIASEDLHSYLANQTKIELENGGDRDPLTKIRLLCFKRGATGILGLGRVFSKMDDDGSKALNEGEFIRGMKEFGLDVSDAQIKDLFKTFDEDGSGSISITEFLLKLRPPMSPARREIVEQAFAKMDRNRDGIITLDDLKNVYTAKKHPKFQSGAMSEDEILTEFLNTFEGGRGNLDGKITKEEFINYYETLSTSIDDDGFFELMVQRAYHL